MAKVSSMSVDDFLSKIEWEGGIGALSDYFSEEQLAAIEDKKLAQLAVAAKRAMDPLQEYLDELEEQRESGDDEEED